MVKRPSVWRFKSPHQHCRKFVMRTFEPKPHWINKFASVLSIPKFANVAPKNDTNFGIGTLAADIIAQLDLKPHPEGGHYRETFRDSGVDADGRSRSTAIYFLLARGERSHWHRIDAVEVWHYYAGDALTLRIADDAGTRNTTLGADLASGEMPQAIVPAHAWQAAESTGDWTLVGCTVAPGFDFTTFELAPKGWHPD